MTEIFGPSWIDRSSYVLPNAQTVAPRFNLPDGRFIEITNRRADQADADIIGRAGCVAIQNSFDDRSICFEWTHANHLAVAGKPPGTNYGAENLTEQDMEYVVNTIGMSYMYANEIGEGYPWGTPYEAPQVAWFYKYLKKKHDDYNAQNPTNPWPLRNYGMYGSFSNFNGDPWLFRTDGSTTIRPNSPSAPFLGYISSVENARASCAYFSMFEQYDVGAVIKSYADTADYSKDYYQKKFAAHVMGKGMGYIDGLRGPNAKGHLAYLDWPNIEGLGETGPGSLHNGYYWTRAKPDGTIISHEDHPQVGYDWLVGCQFGIGMCLTDGLLPFNAPGKHSPDPASNSYPTEPLGMLDSYFETAYRYSQCDRTAGVGWRYADYRFEGDDNWIVAKNDGTDILDHASAFGGPYAEGNPRRGRPDAMFRVKNNALDFWCFDASQGLNKTDVIIVRPVPNKEYRVELRGGVLRQFRETI